MSAAAYQRAIDILVSGNVDYKAIAIRLAKADPLLFIHLAEHEVPVINAKKHHQLVEIVQAMINKNKITAIKAIREEYSLGLKSAKDIADHLHNYLAAHGQGGERYGDAAYLAAEEISILEEIKQVYHSIYK